MIRLILFLLLALSLPASGQTPSDTIPLRLAHGLLVIPVQIDGQEHNFILDTGMTRSMVGTHLLSEADAQPDSLRTMDAAGRITHQPIFRFNNLQIGNRQIHPLDVMPLPLEGTVWQCLDAEGFIGNNALQGLMLTIDTQAGHVILSESRKQPKAMK